MELDLEAGRRRDSGQTLTQSSDESTSETRHAPLALRWVSSVCVQPPHRTRLALRFFAFTVISFISGVRRPAPPRRSPARAGYPYFAFRTVIF